MEQIQEAGLKIGHGPSEMNVQTWHHDADGNLLEHTEQQNQITNAALAALAAAINGTTAMDFKYMGLGTGSTSGGSAPAAGNTTLVAETSVSGLARVLLSGGERTNIDNGSGVLCKMSWDHTFTNGGTSTAITEAGLFSASSSGTMLSRVAIGPATVANGSTYRILWTITLASA